MSIISELFFGDGGEKIAEAAWREYGRPVADAGCQRLVRWLAADQPVGWLNQSPVKCEHCGALPIVEKLSGVVVGWALHDWYTVRTASGGSLLLCGHCWRQLVWPVLDCGGWNAVP